jgi:chromosome segregation ATPase
MEEEFLDAYRVGSQLHTLRSNVNNANSKIYSKEAELKRTKEKIRAKEAELISDDVTTQDRVMLLADLKELSERTGELEAEIESLVADKARYEYELRDYEQTVAAYGY